MSYLGGRLGARDRGAGLLVIAALVGVASGLGSVVFRYLKGGAGRW